MGLPVRFATVSGHRLAWYEQGQGQPVLCLHGNPSWSVLFRPLFSGLSDRFRVLSLDQAGCGQSGPPQPDFSWDLTARITDFDGWIQQVCPTGPVVLVAHDWGGMIATSWAVDHPDRVAAMVLMNTAAFRLPRGKSLPRTIAWCRDPLVGPTLTRGLNGFLGGAIRYCTTKPLSAEAAQAYLGPHGSWSSRRSIWEFVRDIPLKEGDRSWNRLKQTEEKLHLLAQKPLFFPWGMKDFVFDGDYLAEWKRHFPQARFQPYPEAGHWLLEDEPDQVTRAIRSFLTEVPPPQSGGASR